MFVDIGFSGVFAFAKSIKMELSDETTELFQFEVLNQNLTLKLFSINDLYPCTVNTPSY